MKAAKNKLLSSGFDVEKQVIVLKPASRKYVSSLNKEFSNFLKRSPIAPNKLAKQIGVDLEMLMEWKNFKLEEGNSYLTSGPFDEYGRDDIDEINSRVRDYLDNNANSDEDLIFTTTKNVERVFKVVDRIRKDKKVGMLIAPPGSGKTRCVQQWMYECKHQIFYMAMNRTTCSMTEAIQRIYEAAGFEDQVCYGKSLRKKVDDILNYFRLKFDMVIIDEAHYLGRDALDLLRTICDELRMPMLLVGIPTLNSVLKGRSAESQQLASRISIYYEFPKPDYEEIASIVDANWFGLTYELKNLLYKYCFGSLRILSHLIYQCRLILEENDLEKLSEDVIKTAAAQLPRSVYRVEI